MKKIALAVALLGTMAALVGCKKAGEITEDQWDDADRGMTPEKVVEYLGKPKEKTMRPGEIRRSFSFISSTKDDSGAIAVLDKSLPEDGNDRPSTFFALDEQLEEMQFSVTDDTAEMYTYTVEDNELDATIYFVNNKLVTKLFMKTSDDD